MFLKNIVVLDNDVSLADVFVCTTVQIHHPNIQCLVSCHIAAKHFICATFCVFYVTLIKVHGSVIALTIQDGNFPFQVPLTLFAPNNFIVTLMSLVARGIKKYKDGGV